MNKKYILFDLDGTIIDSSIGITNSVMYSLKHFGIEVTDRTKLYKFIGPSLWESFEKYYNFSNEQIDIAIEKYRENYTSKGIHENTVYDGLQELFEFLKNLDKQLIIATAKPEIFAKKILSELNLAHYFTFIGGSELDGTRKEKDEVIDYVLKNCNITDLSQAIMIGDRDYDIRGAKKVGIDSVGVLYGYGSYDELYTAGATYIAKNVDELKKLFVIN